MREREWLTISRPVRFGTALRGCAAWPFIMRLLHPEIVSTWPPAGYVPEKRGPALYVVNGVFFSLATAVVLTRLHTRIFVRRWFGLDDALILFAWFCALGDLGTLLYAYHRFWWDRHLWEAKPEFLTPGTKANFVLKIFWTTSSSAVRLSLLVLYYRLLNHLDLRKYRWVVHAATFLVVGIYLSYLGTIVFACIPIHAYFEWPSPGRCVNEAYVYTILSAFNTFSEALVAAMPVPVLLRLKMDSAQRWAVMSLLCLGFLVAVVGCVRTYYVWILFDSDDLTWWSGPHWICSEVEICLAMICASAPALRPVLGRLLHWDKNPSNSYYSTTSSLDRKLPANAARAERMMKIKFDIEGIGLDGYGYTVTVTAEKRRRRTLSGGGGAEEWNKGRGGGNGDGDGRLDAVTRPARTLLARLGRRPAVPTEKGIEIRTLHSVDIRESYHPSARDWDARNPYAKQPTVSASDLSLLRGRSFLSDADDDVIDLTAVADRGTVTVRAES
ncbi:hypothetical protein EJ06DRAFT_560395 [Trichodelitschia bisporula]|uniref:Rhodopsin domain-containing protein n=1 Tax=Trichodelitschia bisporula TaxID=703511 RepID=A0A6G1HJI9_9PEZI|nr:hypothetical protein EJ06DRAFT_560395 [Trichodelitschia bisporula]